ncbi:MAG: LytR/AlgR family response regulator transcription factor [Terriglobales bacterium]|jgi:DNA-binding LytR/AlgR family response regulator
MATTTLNSYVPGVETTIAEAPREYPKKIVIRSQNRIFLQTVAEIEYLTAAANYVHVHAAGQVFRIRSTMSEIQQRLDPRTFGRIHRCTLVNFESVKEYRPLQRGDFMLTLNNGSQLKMSRRHREQLDKVISLSCAVGKHLVKYGSDSKEYGAVAADPFSGRRPSLV